MKIMKNEIWKPVKNYEQCYEVSNFGNVRSVDRSIIKNNGVHYQRKGKQLKLQENIHNGYYQVMLFINRRCKLCYVHRLVAESFISNPNGFKYVTHLNGNKQDNRVVNLTFISSMNNILKR